MQKSRKPLRRVEGTSERPRLVVRKTNKRICLSLVDDREGRTLTGISQAGKNMTAGTEAGKRIAELAAGKNIQKVVFDRGKYRYHGVVKAISTAAKESGLLH